MMTPKQKRDFSRHLDTLTLGEMLDLAQELDDACRDLYTLYPPDNRTAGDAHRIVEMESKYALTTARTRSIIGR